LLRLFGALAAVLLLLAGFVMGRLLEGPLALDRIPPSLATVLGRAAGGVAIAIAGIRLGLDRDRHALDLEMSGVRLKRPDGELLAAFPEIRTSFALTSLLRGRPRATRLVLERPMVRLIRDPDGAVRLGFGGGAQPPALAPAVLAGLAASPSPEAPFVMPTRISVRDAAVVLDDRQSGRRWRANHVDIALVRKAGGFSGDLSLAAAIGTRTSALHLGYSYAAAARTLELVLDFGNIEPAALASLDPVLAPLAALHVPLSGTFAIRLAGAPLHAEGMRLDVGFARGRVESALLPGGGLALAGGELHADYAPRQGRLRLLKLAADLGGGSLVAIDGAIRSGPAAVSRLPGLLSGRFRIVLSHIPVAKFASLWPTALSPGARRWVLANIRRGTLERGDFWLDLALDPRARMAKLVSVRGKLRYHDLTIHYRDGLAPLRRVAGTARLRPERIDFRPASGRLGAVRVTGGAVRITDLDKPVQRLAADLTASGPLRGALALLAHAPGGYGRRIGLDPARLGGRMTAAVDFALPLVKDLRPSDIAFTVTAQLRDASVSRVVMGKSLTSGAFTLDATRSGLALKGKARLGEVPAAIAARLYFTPANGLQARYHLAATLDDAERRRLGIDLPPDHVAGPLGVDLTYSQFAAGGGKLTALLDLRKARLALAEAGWAKPPGLPARARVTLDLADRGVAVSSRIALAAPGLSADLALAFDPASGRIVRVDAARLVAGDDDVSGTAMRGIGGGWHVALSGRSLDVSPWLQRPGAEADGHARRLTLDARLGRLILGPKRVLHAVRARLVRAGARWRSVRLDGRLDGGGGLTLRFGGDPAAQPLLSFHCDDFGALLRLFAVTDSVVGGRVAVAGTIAPGGGRPVLRARFKGADYHLVHAPIFAKILSLASLPAAASMLSGSGIPFTTLRGDFAYTGDRLVVEDLLAYGGAIGITANGAYTLAGNRLDLQGTIIPAYTLNSIIGNVPVLGALLLGGKGQGLIAANYRLTGPSAAPEITVDPLSALAPGFLRRLLQPNFGMPPSLARP
jgi:hypothetical protein